MAYFLRTNQSVRHTDHWPSNHGFAYWKVLKSSLLKNIWVLLSVVYQLQLFVARDVLWVAAKKSIVLISRKHMKVSILYPCLLVCLFGLLWTKARLFDESCYAKLEWKRCRMENRIHYLIDSQQSSLQSCCSKLTVGFFDREMLIEYIPEKLCSSDWCISRGDI